MAESIRVVSWNCNQGLARKSPRLVELDPDIAVICEAGDLPILDEGRLRRIAWSGPNTNKGLAVYVRRGLRATVDPAWDETRQHFLPVHIDIGGGLDVLAVWAMNHRSEEPRPKRGRTLDALKTYRPFLSGGRSLVIGDFNDNARWDKRSSRRFTQAVDQLATTGHASAYHARSGETQGEETAASYFHHYSTQKPYLIDHAFVPERWLPRIHRFEIGAAEDWLKSSDHMPLVLEVDRPLV
jgi:hypothetical protein